MVWRRFSLEATDLQRATAGMSSWPLLMEKLKKTDWRASHSSLKIGMPLEIYFWSVLVFPNNKNTGKASAA